MFVNGLGYTLLLVDSQADSGMCVNGTVDLLVGRPFVKRFVLCYRTVVLSVLSATLVYCSQTIGRIKMNLGMGVGLGPGHIVLDPGLLPKRARPPIFGPYLLWPNGSMDQGARPKRHCVRWGPSSPPQKGDRASPNFWPLSCGQTAAWIKMPLGMAVGLGPGHIVLDEVLPKKEHRAPQFSAHVYCGQTAAWIKMPLGVKVGLVPRYIVLDGDPASLPKKGASSPQYSADVYCGQTAGWVNLDATWYDGRHRPGQQCVRCGPSFAPRAQPPALKTKIGPCHVVAKRLDGSRCHLVRR